jgi:hypothetical protein
MEPVRGKVTAVEPDRVLLELQDGRELLLPAMDEISDLAQPGSEVLVYFDLHGRVQGWYLPDANTGIDLRNPKGAA